VYKISYNYIVGFCYENIKVLYERKVEMSSQKINEIKKKRENERFRKKKSQIPYAIITTIIGMLFYIYLLKNNNYNSIFWIIGIATGFVLQRARLCFTAGFRDPFMVGSTTVFRGVLIGIIIR